MRVIFFGTPEFAVPSLRALLERGIDVAAVVTQPDRARGRSHSRLLPSPVKVAALAAGIPVRQPDRPRGDLFMHDIRALRADLGIVVAYGHLLPPRLLAEPRLGFVNVHASLLPRWRGAAPVQWALLAGDGETGVSIMRIEAGLDTGAVWLERRAPIADDDTTGSLFARLATLGAAALVDALPKIAAGDAPVPQDDLRATVAPRIDRDTARIRWNEPAAAVARRIRAMDPAPGAWAVVDHHEVKCFGARPHPLAGHADAAPGELVVVHGQMVVAAGDAAEGHGIAIDALQPAGKRRMPAADWLRGRRLDALRFA